jgi:hypothetical protein
MHKKYMKENDWHEYKSCAQDYFDDFTFQFGGDFYSFSMR